MIGTMRKHLILGMACAASVVLLSGCAQAPKPFTVHGTISVPGGFNDNTLECTPDDGYGDISQGAQVVVEDATSKTVGVASLGTPTSALGVCVFKFTVRVPPGSAFYKVTTGTRGGVQYTQAQLEHGIALTLGQ